MRAHRPPGQFIIERLAPLVPAVRRSEWVAEWTGELEHAYRAAAGGGGLAWRTRWRLRLRALSALRDVHWLRRMYGVPRGGGSALRDAARVLRRQPGFALMVVCTLSLGIGGATAIFSAVDGLMLRPLPFREPERLVEVWVTRGSSISPYLSEEEAEAWRSGGEAVFESLHAHGGGRSLTRTGQGEPEAFRPSLIEPGFLAMLGTPPSLGREFVAEEAVSGGARVVVLSHEVWLRSFGGDRDIVGATVHFDDEPYTVVGVAPPSVRLLQGGIPQLLIPMSDATRSALMSGRPTMMTGRLRADLSLDGAQARLDAVAASLAESMPREGGWGIRLRPVERLLRDATKRALVALSVAVTLLLLIACVNAAGLLFVRGVARRPEMTVRRALGATPAALFRQALAESLLLATCAGALGLAFAWWGVRVLSALAPSALLQFSHTPVGIDARVLTFALLLTALVGLGFGVAPALRVARAASQGNPRSTSSRSETRLRSAVQAVQVALAVLLLAGAGLFARSFMAITTVAPGFEPRNLIELSYSLPSFRYREDAARVAFHANVDVQLRALPGVRAMSWTNGGVGAVGVMTAAAFEVEDGTPASSGTAMLPFVNVDTAYFRTMGIALRDGRAFLPEEVVAEADVAIIDADLAALLWPGERAVGRRFRVGADEPWLTVVGVTGDVKLEGPDDPLGPYLMFLPAAMGGYRTANIVVRTAGDAAALVPAVRQVIQSLDPGGPIRLETAERLLGEIVAQPRFLLVVMGSFATIALLLATVGIYGLVSFTVVRRTREIGIRIAIGARKGQVLRAVLARGLAIGGAGLALGLAAAAATTRFTKALLFGISPLDPVTLVGVCVLLAASFTAALILPSLRAARIDAARALRAD